MQNKHLYPPGTRFDFVSGSVFIPCKDRGVYYYRFGKVFVEARLLKAAAGELIIETRRRGECFWKKAQATLNSSNLQQQIRFVAGRRNNLV